MMRRRISLTSCPQNRQQLNLPGSGCDFGNRSQLGLVAVSTVRRRALLCHVVMIVDEPLIALDLEDLLERNEAVTSTRPPRIVGGPVERIRITRRFCDQTVRNWRHRLEHAIAANQRVEQPCR